MISNSQNESKINDKKYSEIEFIASGFFGHVYKVKNNVHKYKIKILNNLILLKILNIFKIRFKKNTLL